MPKIAELAKQLPAGVAADAAEHALILASMSAGDALGSLGQIALAGRGGDAAAERILARWAAAGDHYWLAAGLGKGVKALPPARRASLCKKLATGELAAESLAIAEGGARVAAEGWPPNVDLAPVIDRIEALAEEHAEAPDDGWTRVVLAFSSAFDAANAQKGKTLARVVEAFFASGTRPWNVLERTLGDHLGKKLAPAALRPLAERAAASDRVSTMRWGLELLALTLAPKDKPVIDSLRVFCADPRLRRGVAVSRPLSQQCLPLLRAALREGGLDGDTAVHVMETIHSFYRGLIPWPYEPIVLEADMEKLDPLLGPPELRGPPTDEEWAALRVARDAPPPHGAGDIRSSVRVLPPGPWDPADRAFVRRAIDAVRDGDDGAFLVAHAVAAKPDAEALRMFDEIFSLLDDEDQGMTRDLRAKIVEVTGEIDATGAPAPAAAAPAAAPVVREWMDEPDEDEDEDEDD
jgi:hypothetical protein